MWIDQPPLKGLHWLTPVCNSIAQMCECQEEQSVCACTFLCGFLCLQVLLPFPYCIDLPLLMRRGLTWSLWETSVLRFSVHLAQSVNHLASMSLGVCVTRCWPRLFLILPGVCWFCLWSTMRERKKLVDASSSTLLLLLMFLAWKSGAVFRCICW